MTDPDNEIKDNNADDKHVEWSSVPEFLLSRYCRGMISVSCDLGHSIIMVTTYPNHIII